MTRKTMWRDIARIKRVAGIDFEKIEYDAAMERQWARLDLVLENAMPKFQARFEKKYGRPVDLSGHFPSAERLKKARALLHDDTLEKWIEDQETLERYHLRRDGDLGYLEWGYVFGRTSREMFDHYLDVIFRPAREELKQELERQREREEIEKEKGKPVRHHPERYHDTSGHYTPQFRNGAMGWGLSHLYPYEDYPESDGKSVVILDPEWDEKTMNVCRT